MYKRCESHVSNQIKLNKFDCMQSIKYRIYLYQIKKSINKAAKVNKHLTASVRVNLQVGELIESIYGRTATSNYFTVYKFKTIGMSIFTSCNFFYAYQM